METLGLRRKMLAVPPVMFFQVNPVMESSLGISELKPNLKSLPYLRKTWPNSKIGPPSKSTTAPRIFENLRIHMAGSNGTAGTAMAIPVFEEEKWRRLDSNTCMDDCD